MHILPPTEEEESKVLEIIKQTATKNRYSHKLIDQVNRILQNKQKPPLERNNNKLFTFTYVNPTHRKITNIIK